MQGNPILQYKNQAVSTMSQGEQLILLYKEAIKQLRYGSQMFKQQNYATAEKCTEKCKKIFNYLSSVLNRQYSISSELYQLYFFINQEIIRAEVKQDGTILEELIPLVEDLCNTWVQAQKLNHMHKS